MQNKVHSAEHATARAQGALPLPLEHGAATAPCMRPAAVAAPVQYGLLRDFLGSVVKATCGRPGGTRSMSGNGSEGRVLEACRCQSEGSGEHSGKGLSGTAGEQPLKGAADATGRRGCSSDCAMAVRWQLQARWGSHTRATCASQRAHSGLTLSPCLVVDNQVNGAAHGVLGQLAHVQSLVHNALACGAGQGSGHGQPVATDASKAKETRRRERAVEVLLDKIGSTM